MGWCQSFGPQIRDGCDHAMVAGYDSCSCPECGVVCPGRFAGCPTVWAAGPQDVTLRRPAREPTAARALPAPAPATNGTGSVPGRSAPALAAGPVSYPSADNNGDLRPLLHALRAEMQVLSRKVDQIQQPAPYSGPAGADRALGAVEALPGLIAEAVAEALREQHKAMQVELGVLRVQLAADIESVHEALGQPVSSEQIITAVEARFEWLVNELSERFVILGNEMARINQHLTAAGLGASASNGHGEQVPPILREVDRLADQMEDIIEVLRSPGTHTLRVIESP